LGFFLSEEVAKRMGLRTHLSFFRMKESCSQKFFMRMRDAGRRVRLLSAKRVSEGVCRP